MLKGIDISKWQNTAAVDLGEDFVIVKATEGVGYVDPTCDTKYQYAKSKGKLLGVYHFARPDLSSAVAEADYFIDNTVGYHKEAILVLDWEAGNTTNVGWALAFLRRVRDRTGIKPIIYMSASVIKSANWQPVVDEDFGLWVAGYPDRYNVTNPPVPAEDEMPYDISPWGFAAIWQYTSSAGTLDRDVAYMSRDAWSKYAGKVTTPAPHVPVITTNDLTDVTVIPFETTRTPDATKLVGEEVVIEDGVNGSRTVVTRVTYTDGVETERVISSDRTTNPKSQVIYFGTKEPEVVIPEEPVEQPPENPDPTPNPSEPSGGGDSNQQQGRFSQLIYTKLMKLIKDMNSNALFVRAFKTFVQAGLATWAVTNFDFTTGAIVGAIAAGISALMNLFIQPVEAK